MSNKIFLSLGLAFFISGASAILYEVLWIRLLSLAFGGVTLTTGVVTALFLSGLALGAFWGGKFVDRLAKGGTKRLFIFYLVIELIIACWGIINWRTFSYFSLTAGDWRYPVTYLFILVQTVIIGSTWPLMFKIFLGLGSQWKVSGLIVFLNTIGGAFGALFASFFLLASIGVFGTLLAAGAGNMLAGLTVGFLGKRNDEEIAVRPDKIRSKERSLSPFLITLALFGAGFLGMALEIFWMRSFGLVLGSSVYSFTLVLFVILFGLALGGIIINRWDEKISANIFVWFFYISSLLIFLGLVFISKAPEMVVWWFEKFGKTFISFWVLGIFLISGIALLPSIVSGMIFAKGIVLLKDSFDIAGRKAGFAYFANTLGGVLGGLISALFLLSWLGLREGIVVLGSLGILVYLWLYISSKGLSQSLFIWLLIPVAVAFYGVVNWDKRVISSGAWLYGSDALRKTAGIKVLSYKDGREATITTTWREGTTSLFTNGKADASTDIDDMGTQAILGHVPILLYQNPQKVLVIGLGSGVTAGAISQHPKVEKIVVAEIEPEVVKVAGKFFKEANYDVLNNPKTSLYIGDGRNFLLQSREQFDIITSEPSNPWIIGHSKLFTQEFFKLGRDHLGEDGVFFQWLHLYNMRPNEVKSIIATFHSVFPYVQLWTSTNPVDIFLAGKKKPFNLSWNRFQEALDNPGVRESLARRGLDDGIRLLSLLWAGTEVVESLSSGGEIHTDNRPILEYKTPLGLFEDTLNDNFDLLLSYFQEGENIFDIGGMPKLEIERMANARRARLYLVKARRQMEDGKVDEAISLAEKGLSFDSQAPRLKWVLAQLYYEKAAGISDGRSMESYQKAISLDENYYNPYVNLLQVYIHNEMMENAQKLIEKGKKKFPWSGRILIYEGVIAGHKGDYKKAEELLLRAKELEPWSVLVRNNLAHLYSLQGELELAIKEWKESLSLNSNQPEIRDRLKINLIKQRGKQ